MIVMFRLFYLRIYILIAPCWRALPAEPCLATMIHGLTSAFRVISEAESRELCQRRVSAMARFTALPGFGAARFANLRILSASTSES